ncbi:HPr family phosphocarrier protein [Effusibacillus consociatus]|uniref:HPr family phosphocarrier protein n=1 Tax=Effusibacillus consociatus TaxID=1117041 RepID=A0ABV9Q3Y2_9BACL
MVSKELSIQNEQGFHVRPAQLFVQNASKFASNIQVITEKGLKVDGKSILGLMTLGLAKGSKITIEASGTDEEEALDALADLVESKFGEE